MNLTRLLEQSTFEFAPVLAEKQLTWRLQLAPDVPLHCDPDKLQRVFDNLFRNAVNYSYPSTEIRVCLSRYVGGVRVLVQNRGATIPEEKLTRIFSQFFRLDTARRSDTGGAGLGLAIAKKIVEAHGGCITARSADETVTFIVSLPETCQKNV